MRSDRRPSHGTRVQQLFASQTLMRFSTYPLRRPHTNSSISLIGSGSVFSAGSTPVRHRSRVSDNHMPRWVPPRTRQGPRPVRNSVSSNAYTLDLAAARVRLCTSQLMLSRHRGTRSLSSHRRGQHYPNLRHARQESGVGSFGRTSNFP